MYSSYGLRPLSEWAFWPILCITVCAFLRLSVDPQCRLCSLFLITSFGLSRSTMAGNAHHCLSASWSSGQRPAVLLAQQQSPVMAPASLLQPQAAQARAHAATQARSAAICRPERYTGAGWRLKAQYQPSDSVLAHSYQPDGPTPARCRIKATHTHAAGATWMPLDNLVQVAKDSDHVWETMDIRRSMLFHRRLQGG